MLINRFLLEYLRLVYLGLLVTKNLHENAHEASWYLEKPTYRLEIFSERWKIKLNEQIRRIHITTGSMKYNFFLPYMEKAY